LVAFAANAQTFDFKSTHGLTLDSASSTTPTYMTTAYVSPAPAVTSTIFVVVTKISGTVGGTLSLQGSIDGTNYKALNTPNTATALATFTATDATNTYHWVISGSPFLYYRVAWTGSSGQLASYSAKLFRSK
jgi:hypothetical protein